MSIAKTTEDYIENHPSVKDCVIKDIVNFSNLSRQIIKDSQLKKSDFDAVLIACRRYQRSNKQRHANEDLIIDLLEKSKIEVRTKICVAVIDKAVLTDELLSLEKEARKRKDIFYAIEGTSVITLVIPEQLLPLARRTFRNSIEKAQTDLALVIITSPEDIEETVGFFSYTSSLLSYVNVNIIETMSCFAETLFVIEEKDIGESMKALSP